MPRYDICLNSELTGNNFFTMGSSKIGELANAGFVIYGNASFVVSRNAGFVVSLA